MVTKLDCPNDECEYSVEQANTDAEADGPQVGPTKVGIYECPKCETVFDDGIHDVDRHEESSRNPREFDFDSAEEAKEAIERGDVDIA